jgi:hypothetical protein
VTHFFVVVLQRLEMQSDEAVQLDPSAHFVVHVPPQSTSASPVSLVPLLQAGAAHAGHFEPPQSTPVSSPFFVPSVHEGAGPPDEDDVDELVEPEDDEPEEEDDDAPDDELAPPPASTPDVLSVAGVLLPEHPTATTRHPILAVTPILRMVASP